MHTPAQEYCNCLPSYTPGSHAAAHWPGYEDPGGTENPAGTNEILEAMQMAEVELEMIMEFIIEKQGAV